MKCYVFVRIQVVVHVIVNDFSVCESMRESTVTVTI